MSHDITLTWRKLTGAVGDKVLVNQSTGYATPGLTLAIMGPSGAGKTTLLSMLAGKRPKKMTVTGDVFANGAAFTSKQFNKFGSFVYQQDILFEALTVRCTQLVNLECLQFAADLKLRGTQAHRDQTVNSIIAELQLQKCQNTYIGGKFVQGVSGGERKRTCVGIQMISNPSVLILDEPTSGLDSFTAAIILGMLSRIAKQGKTVIFTIHQPSSRLFNMLDRLILLHRGDTIYQGDAQGIVPYMSSLGIEMHAKYNISDFFMLEVSDYKRKTSHNETKLNEQAYRQRLQPAIEQQVSKMVATDTDGFMEEEPVRGTCYQIARIFKRSWIQTLRHPMMMKNRFMNIIITTLIFGGIFFNAGEDGRPEPGSLVSPLELQNYLFSLQGVCFTNVTSMIMNGIFSIALLFPVEREVYLKEESSKTYSAFSYYIGKTLIEIPLAFIFSFLYAACGYWMLGLTKDFDHWFAFALTLIAMTLTGNGLGLMLGCLFEDANKTAAMAPAFIMPLMVFSGLYNKTGSIPGWIAWMQYLSPFKYGLQSLLYNELHGITYQIKVGPFIETIDPLAFLDVDVTSYQAIGILMGVSALFYLLGFVFLKVFVSQLA